MTPQANKRQPLSCENCRKRKIKCTGEKPCRTCVHRGFGHTCSYLRHIASASQTPARPDELLERMKRVEATLERQTQLLEQQLSIATSTPTPRIVETRLQTQSPLISSSLGAPILSGTLRTSIDGYQRFVPGSIASEAQTGNDLLLTCTVDSDFPFSAEAKCSHQSLLEFLPPGRQCEQLKDIFFKVFSPLFHILHDPTFEEEYLSFRRNPQKSSLSFLALLYVVMSLAVTSLDDRDPLLPDLGHAESPAANIKALATKYRSAAMRCLSADQFMWRHNLNTLQALILLIYAMNHAHGPAWALLGTTFNIAVSIGCHVDPLQLGLDGVECERRRRCWAALMMLFTIQNTCLGNISPMMVAADVRLPADVDDEAITLNNSQTTPSDNTAQAAPTKMSYILYKFRLYQLAADVCRSIHQNEVLHTLIELDQRIIHESEEHEARFTNVGHLPIYHQAHYRILQNYTYHLRLLLHRPYLQPQGCTYDSQDFYFKQQVLQSREICKLCALKILENHARLYEFEEFKPYRWFVYGLGSFHAFLAAVTCTVILFFAAESEVPDPDWVVILKSLQTCHERFRRMSTRSDICMKAAEALDRIMPPVLSGVHQDTGREHDPETYHSAPSLTDTSSAVSMDPATTGIQFLCDYAPQLQDMLDISPEEWLCGPSTG